VTTATEIIITATPMATDATAIRVIGLEKFDLLRESIFFAIKISKLNIRNFITLQKYSKNRISMFKKFFIVCILIGLNSFAFSQKLAITTGKDIYPKDIKTGAEQTENYFPMLTGKNIAVVANQTSMIKNVHLVDSLLKAGLKIKKVFCPEHGFRGQAEAGEKVGNVKDEKTGIPVVSLYGKGYKPQKKDLKGIDIIVFDIQDVGARFYTYISTMTYVMEACAENNITFLILDRPNPNGFYVDGPVLEKGYKSFIGLHPVPIVHGMTIAEYAKMVNGERWLKDSLICKLFYVLVKGYDHTMYYQLPVRPSPNLPDMRSIYLYPSICLLEGSKLSIGRGTEKPFQLVGYPTLKGEVSFTPKSLPGFSLFPPLKDTLCYGYDLGAQAESIKQTKKLYLSFILKVYKELPDKTGFFISSFNILAGNSKLKEQIINGVSEEDIRKSWQPALDNYKTIRKKYLLYKDFE
jgi:uncharacterized protein YbbC (DUF1343 family)